jgi:hypothetical protein
MKRGLHKSERFNGDTSSGLLGFLLVAGNGVEHKFLTEHRGQTAFEL